MATAREHSTRVSLIKVLSSGDTGEAWSVFIEKYGPLFYYWCGQWGATPEDAEDVIQDTLLNVFKSIDSYRFQPDGSFRQWLKTIARRSWHSICEKQARSLQGERPIFKSMVHKDPAKELQARESLMNCFDELARTEILELAFDRVRNRVEARNWEVFERMDLQEQSGEEVAEQFQMSLGAVYVVACRVRSLIHREVLLIDPQESRP